MPGQLVSKPQMIFFAKNDKNTSFDIMIGNDTGTLVDMPRVVCFA